MGKKIEVILLSIVLMTLNLYSAGLQVQLNNGMWQAVGFQGSYTTDAQAVGYDSDDSFEFIDRADDNITWVRVNPSNSDQLAYNGVNGATDTYGITTQLESVIGLFAINGKRSKKNTNFTTLDGSLESVVKLKIKNPLPYRNDVLMYRMYIEGQTGVPAFRIDFQADYQGQPFRVRFGEEPESYSSHFNYENTYDNPASLDVDTLEGDKKGSSVDIVDAIDFNITDNNQTAFLTTNLFKVKTSTGTYTSVYRPYTADAGNRIEVYSMVNNIVWNRFDTANTLTTSNTLKKFTSGRGYWVRATSKQAHNDGNYTKIGLLTSNNVKINEDEIYGQLGNGWHMLSFGESDLRYAPTGVFIPRSVYGNAARGITIYLNRHASNIDLNDTNQTRGSTITTEFMGFPDVGVNFAKIINLGSIASNLLYGESVKMRAYPAMAEVAGAGNVGADGVIILADNLFEVNNTTDITTLAGSSLQSTSRGFFSSRFGEFMLAAKLNDLGGEEINATISFSMPKYRSTEAQVTDLNDTNRTQMLSSILGGLRLAATKTGETTPSTIVSGYLFSADFNETGVDNRDPNSTAFPDIFLAAGARFSMADTTTVRVYEFVQNGSFKVLGSIGSSNVTPSIEDKNITRTVNAINSVASETGINARALDSTYFMISASAGTIVLEEDYNATLFKDISLSSALIPANTRDLTKGSIIDVFSHRDLLDREISIDVSLLDGGVEGNNSTDSNVSWAQLYEYNLTNDPIGIPNPDLTSPTLVQNLGSNAIWALDFPIKLSLIQKFAKYNKEITNISMQRFSHDNIAYYDFLDLTKDPDDWYGNTYNTDADLRFDNDYQGIFHIFPNQNYWVKIKDKPVLPSSTVAMSNDSSITYSAKPAFNNTIKDGVGVTENHISDSLNVKFNDAFIDPLVKDYYNVVAIIGGIRYYLRDNGRYFSLDIDDLKMNLVSKMGTEADDPIFINAYDGAGNILKEEGATARFSIYFKKPPKPIINFDDNGKLVIDNKGDYEIEQYTTFISDIASKRESSKFTLEDVNDTKLTWKSSGDESTYGNVLPLRIVLKDAKYDLYSDIKAILYAPLSEGHVLKVTKTRKVEKIPYSYIQKQMLVNQEAGSKTFDKYDGNNGVDNGIQMAMLDGANEGDVSLCYYPEGAESQRRITQFGGTRTMYIGLSEDGSTNDKAVVSITYLPSYEDKLFYLSFNDKLYQGRFQSNDSYNSDSSVYDLSTRTLNIDTVINTSGLSQVLPTDTQGFEIESGSIGLQSIAIPTPVIAPAPVVTPTPAPVVTPTPAVAPAPVLP